MTTIQKISWINEKISSLVEEIKKLKQENTRLKEVEVTENSSLKIKVEAYEEIISKKDIEIAELKQSLKLREAEIDDVVAKIDLLLNA